MSLWLVGAACTRGVENPWTIFSIVRLPAPYEIISLVALGCPELCLAWWLICLLAG
jgi:hypothetical protein